MDSSGICTRQLPDSVIILFFPNEQNLRGLTQVVRDIRAESDGPRDKSIALHFVMSNVPGLDDEDLITKDKISGNYSATICCSDVGFCGYLVVVYVLRIQFIGPDSRR